MIISDWNSILARARARAESTEYQQSVVIIIKYLYTKQNNKEPWFWLGGGSIVKTYTIHIQYRCNTTRLRIVHTHYVIYIHIISHTYTLCDMHTHCHIVTSGITPSVFHKSHKLCREGRPCRGSVAFVCDLSNSCTYYTYLTLSSHLNHAHHMALIGGGD